MNYLHEQRIKENTLLDRLQEYAASDAYPFHMPGHKRNKLEEEKLGNFPEPFSIDITEIYGFDDLHHPEGILKASMEKTAEIYGAGESRYLVNGSSCGILAAVSGCTERGGRILISRNCHKSVYHAIVLNHLKSAYVYPQVIDELGINGGILPEDVEKQLARYPDTQAVLVVSPTYDGVVSDIREIARVVHQRNIPLIVDEAHGAHFSFGKKGEYPASALSEGADVVIQSLHKTLPSLTQTAVIHLNQSRCLGQKKLDRIKWYLSVYQTSSPSYLFMASIERCVLYMNGQGRERLSWLFNQTEAFREEAKKLSLLQVPGKEWIGKKGIFDWDSSKLILHLGKTGKSGLWLGDKLRKEFHLELEMCAPRYGLALTSLWDRQEGFDRLLQAMQAVDHELFLELGNGQQLSERERETDLQEKFFFLQEKERQVMEIGEAVGLPAEDKILEQCLGRISAEYVYLYPPGIPCLVPGEKIDQEIIRSIQEYQKAGFSVHGLNGKHGEFLPVICETSL